MVKFLLALAGGGFLSLFYYIGFETKLKICSLSLKILIFLLIIFSAIALIISILCGVYAITLIYKRADGRLSLPKQWTTGGPAAKKITTQELSGLAALISIGILYVIYFAQIFF